jgi:uncharacterized membrane protein YhaH (DUF805 family)
MSWVLLLTSFTGRINRARFWLGWAIHSPDPLASQTTATA